jgi:hypothetical protein
MLREVMVKRLLVALLPLLLGSGCIVTRLSRPTYEGTVVDSATEAPLPEVEGKWGELSLKTDQRGRFFVRAVTYRELTWIGYETPPLHVYFTLHKAGYCDHAVQGFNPFGGGGSPDDAESG